MIKKRLVTLLLLMVIFVFSGLLNCKKDSSSQETTDVSTMNSCVVTFVEGKAFLANSDDDLIQLAVGDKLEENSVVKTGDNAIIEFKIGEGSIVRLKENSEIKISKLYKDGNSQNTKLFVDIGEVFAQPERINEGSSFEIETESVTAGVRGTKFVVIVTEDKVSKIAVKKGKVVVKKNLNIGDSIKKVEQYSPEVAKIINESVQEELVLEPNEKLEISYEKVTSLQEEVNNKINNISEELAKVKDSKEELEKIVDKVRTEKVKEISTVIKSVAKKQEVKEEEWKEEFDATQFNDTGETENTETINTNANTEDTTVKDTNVKENKKEKILVKETVIEKTGLNLGVSFDSKKTATTFGNGNYVVSDNKNKKIFCIDLNKNRVKWTYTGASSITSPATVFNKEVILSSFDNIVSINSSGKVKNKATVTNGTTNWAKPSVVNNKLYIPTSRTIYQYDGVSFKELNNFPVSTGQLYVSGSGKDLFILDFLYSTAKVFNTDSNSVSWESEKMPNPLYMAPVKAGKYLVIADGVNTLYRYDYASSSTKAKTLSLSGGVLSKMVYASGNIYVVTTDGYFSKVSLGKFNKASKIMKIEANPAKNVLLVKSLVLINDKIYWASDTGKLFVYDTKTQDAKLLPIKDNTGNPLIGTPASSRGNVYVLDTAGSLYKLSEKEHYEYK